MLTLWEVADEISHRLASIFLRNEQCQRPVYGFSEKFQNDPHWQDLILFYEYFHGDIGAGIGASHQTGWTGLIARLLMIQATVDPQEVLEKGFLSVAFSHIARSRVPTSLPIEEGIYTGGSCS